MAKQMTDTSTFQKLEHEAYTAYLEWHVFLVMRIKQLQQHLADAANGISTPALEYKKKEKKT